MAWSIQSEWLKRISLADKCVILFGGAVVLIVLVALSVPWLRMGALVDVGQLELSRNLAIVWSEAHRAEGGGAVAAEMARAAGFEAERLTPEEARARAAGDRVLRRMLRRLESDPGREGAQHARWEGATRVYRYLGAERDPEHQLLTVVHLARRSTVAAGQLVVNTVYLLSAGTLVLGLALVVFYQITHKIILGPVRSLRETADRVRSGELSVRSEIETGDEFQELSETFNGMLENLSTTNDQLRAINAAMDVKLSELAEANSVLFETNTLKSEFLANVSHELRTPLNSIIGFAELLLEIAERERAAAAQAGADGGKRVRYLENIVSASRSLLALIEDLLTMARLEAGRVDLHLERVNVRDACEGLVALIQPQADRSGVLVRGEVIGDLPLLETDPRRFQQIVFNFLSNAVKFTGPKGSDHRQGEVVLRAERLPPGHAEDDRERVRVSVMDNGPGIPPEEHERVFEKFRQLGEGPTRQFGGTGLGLAIARELAHLLQGEIQVVSDVGRGAMFSLILPVTFNHARAAEQLLEGRFRGALAGRRRWG
ncbi:MAG TPA: HAMP domain-containing sensor histidine kinase [Phycisphaerales bacterium]|nr:HAMP domain-containing sensor histidine kinase [Phycisphaerales bacterium]